MLQGTFHGLGKLGFLPNPGPRYLVRLTAISQINRGIYWIKAQSVFKNPHERDYHDVNFLEWRYNACTELRICCSPGSFGFPSEWLIPMRLGRVGLFDRHQRWICELTSGLQINSVNEISGVNWTGTIMMSCWFHHLMLPVVSVNALGRARKLVFPVQQLEDPVCHSSLFNLTGHQVEMPMEPAPYPATANWDELSTRQRNSGADKIGNHLEGSGIMMPIESIDRLLDPRFGETGLIRTSSLICN